MASSREYPTVPRGNFNAGSVPDGVSVDGKWEHYEISQELSRTESFWLSEYLWTHEKFIGYDKHIVGRCSQRITVPSRSRLHSW